MAYNINALNLCEAYANSRFSVLYQQEAPGALVGCLVQVPPMPDPMWTVDRVDLPRVLYHLDKVGLVKAALSPKYLLLEKLLVEH